MILRHYLYLMCCSGLFLGMALIMLGIFIFDGIKGKKWNYIFLYLFLLCAVLAMVCFIYIKPCI